MAAVGGRGVTLHPPPAPAHNACDVCRSAAADDADNPFIFCDGCGRCTHLTCYGVLNPDVSVWYCYNCAVGAAQKCFLCGEADGGLTKPTDDGRAVHVFCGLASEAVWFASASRLDGVQWDRKKLAAGRAARCVICKEKGGLAIKCTHGTCTSSFHPVCACARGFRVELRSQWNPSIPAWCPEHQRNMVPPARPDVFKEEAVSGVLDGHGVCNREAWLAAHPGALGAQPGLTTDTQQHALQQAAAAAAGVPLPAAVAQHPSASAGIGVSSVSARFASNRSGARAGGKGGASGSHSATQPPPTAPPSGADDDDIPLGAAWVSSVDTGRALRVGIKLALRRHEQAMVTLTELEEGAQGGHGVTSSALHLAAQRAEGGRGGTAAPSAPSLPPASASLVTILQPPGLTATLLWQGARYTTPLLETLREDTAGYGKKTVGLDRTLCGEDGLGSDFVFGRARQAWKLVEQHCGGGDIMPPLPSPALTAVPFAAQHSLVVRHGWGAKHARAADAGDDDVDMVPDGKGGEGYRSLTTAPPEVDGIDAAAFRGPAGLRRVRFTLRVGLAVDGQGAAGGGPPDGGGQEGEGPAAPELPRTVWADGPPSREAPVHAGVSVSSSLVELHDAAATSGVPVLPLGAPRRFNFASMFGRRDHASPLHAPATIVRAEPAHASKMSKLKRRKVDPHGASACASDDLAFEFPSAEGDEAEAGAMDAVVAATGPEGQAPQFVGVKPKAWSGWRWSSRGRGRRGRGRGARGSAGHKRPHAGEGEEGGEGEEEAQGGASSDNDADAQSSAAEDMDGSEAVEDAPSSGRGGSSPSLSRGTSTTQHDAASESAMDVVGEHENEVDEGDNTGVVGKAGIDPELLASRLRALSSLLHVDVVDVEVLEQVPVAALGMRPKPNAAGGTGKQVFFMLGDYSHKKRRRAKQAKKAKGAPDGTPGDTGGGEPPTTDGSNAALALASREFILEVGARGRRVEPTSGTPVDDVGLELWSNVHALHSAQAKTGPLRDKLRAAYLLSWAQDVMNLRVEVERLTLFRLWALLRAACGEDECRAVGMCQHRRTACLELVAWARPKVKGGQPPAVCHDTHLSVKSGALFASSPALDCDHGVGQPAQAAGSSDATGSGWAGQAQSPLARVWLCQTWELWKARWAGHSLDDAGAFPDHMAATVLAAVRDTAVRGAHIRAHTGGDAGPWPTTKPKPTPQQFAHALRLALAAEPVLGALSVPTGGGVEHHDASLSPLVLTSQAALHTLCTRLAVPVPQTSPFVKEVGHGASAMVLPFLASMSPLTAYGGTAQSQVFHVARAALPAFTDVVKAYFSRRLAWSRRIRQAAACHVQARLSSALGFDASHPVSTASSSAGNALLAFMLSALPRLIRDGSEGEPAEDGSALRTAVGLHVAIPSAYMSSVTVGGRGRPFATASLEQRAGGPTFTSVQCSPPMGSLYNSSVAGKSAAAAVASARIAWPVIALNAGRRPVGHLCILPALRSAYEAEACRAVGLRGTLTPLAPGHMEDAAAAGHVARVRTTARTGASRGLGDGKDDHRMDVEGRSATFLQPGSEEEVRTDLRSCMDYLIAQTESNLAAEAREGSHDPAPLGLVTSFNPATGHPLCVPYPPVLALLRSAHDARQLVEACTAGGATPGDASQEVDVVRGATTSKDDGEGAADVAAVAAKVGDGETGRGLSGIVRRKYKRKDAQAVAEAVEGAPFLDADMEAASAMPPRLPLLPHGTSPATLSQAGEHVSAWHTYFTRRRAHAAGSTEEALEDYAQHRATAAAADVQAGLEAAATSTPRACLCGVAQSEDGRLYIGCDTCGTWLHVECVGLSHFAVAFWVLSFACPACRASAGSVTWGRRRDDPVLRDAFLAVAAAGLSAEQVTELMSPRIDTAHAELADFAAYERESGVGSAAAPGASTSDGAHPLPPAATALNAVLRLRPLHSQFPYLKVAAETNMGRALAKGYARFYVILDAPPVAPPGGGGGGAPEASSPPVRSGRRAAPTLSYAAIAKGREGGEPGQAGGGRRGGRTPAGGVTDAAALLLLREQGQGRSVVDVVREERFRATRAAEVQLLSKAHA